MVARYCWEWANKKDKDAMDIIIPEFNFEAQWNLNDDGSLSRFTRHYQSRLNILIATTNIIISDIPYLWFRFFSND